MHDNKVRAQADRQTQKQTDEAGRDRLKTPAEPESQTNKQAGVSDLGECLSALDTHIQQVLQLKRALVDGVTQHL